MTVPSEVSRSGLYNGNGVTTIFDYKFRIVDENHVTVIKRNAAGVETTLVIDADYIVSDVGNPAGGQIATVIPPAVGETITILRNVPFVQETDLENQGPYFAETVEDAFDLAAMRDQQLQEQVTRSVKIPASADVSALDTLIADIVRLGDSADSIDTVAENIDDVVFVADHMSDIQAAPGAAATATAAAGVATGAAGAAEAARDDAVAAKNSADASAADALASKNAAQDAEAASVNAKNQAQASAADAVASANAAAGSAAAALASENTAVASAGATADDRAAVAIDRAGVADDKDAAAGSASAAISSANAAQASETKADKWANNPEDVPVEPGKFSAYHWSKKAEDAAGGGVTSVGLSAPTGFTVSGSPVTGSGTLTFAYASGYTGFTTTLKNKLDGIETGAQVNLPVGTGSGTVAAGDDSRITGAVQTSRSIATQHSLQGGGNLSANRTLSLVGDVATPGNNKVYGTDASGERGWKDDPAGGGIGVDQTWQNVKASRATSTSYQNTTGKPIMVAIRSDSTATAQVSSNNSSWVDVGSFFYGSSTQFIVPPNWYYRFNGPGTIAIWSELR